MIVDSSSNVVEGLSTWVRREGYDKVGVMNTGTCCPQGCSCDGEYRREAVVNRVMKASASNNDE